MSINEVFPNPTVKKVVFQIRFPNLFYIETKIGDFQIKVMNEFPESALIHRRQLLLADIGPEFKIEDIPSDIDKETLTKIWQFKSPKKYELNVLSNSLDINSEYHKTYDLEGGQKFRDIIKFVLDAFFETMQIPIINRIGLRYIDECPIPSKDNDTFKSHYNSVFPLDRFNLSYASGLDFSAVIKKGDYNLRYAESLKKTNEEYKLILDFDAFATNIIPNVCLNTTDELHKIISDEYERTIKEPIYNYMRQKKE